MLQKKFRVLVLHQWKSDRGLYGADKVLLRILEDISPIATSLVVVESEGDFPDAARRLGCDVQVRPMGVLRRKLMNPTGLARATWDIFSSAIWMARQIRRKQISVVLTNTVSVIPGALAARMTGCPHLWIVHEILGGSSALLSGFVSAFSTRIVAVSAQSALSVHRGREKTMSKTVVAYPGVEKQAWNNSDRASVRNEFGLPDNIAAIGMVGRLHYWKGQDYFLDALSELKKRSIGGFRAFIIGAPYQDYPGALDQVRQKSRTLGLDNEVVFCGHRDDIHRIYRGLDIVVAPSIQPEPFGLVVAEAMAAELPVVATAWGGPREMIEDGASGFLVPPDNPAIFSQRLEQLIRTPDMRCEMGARARHRIESSFSAAAFNEAVQRELCRLGAPAR